MNSGAIGRVCFENLLYLLPGCGGVTGWWQSERQFQRGIRAQGIAGLLQLREKGEIAELRGLDVANV